jgi:hypothetical protein
LCQSLDLRHYHQHYYHHQRLLTTSPAAVAAVAAALFATSATVVQVAAAPLPPDREPNLLELTNAQAISEKAAAQRDAVPPATSSTPGGAAPLPLAADNGTSPFGTTAPPQLSSLVGAARAADASTDIDLGSINDGDDNDNADAPGTVVPCWHCYLRTHFLNADQTLMARAEYKHMEKFLSPAEEKCDYLLLGHRSCPSAIANKETERAVKLVQSITQKFCRKKKEKKKPGL